MNIGRRVSMNRRQVVRARTQRAIPALPIAAALAMSPSANGRFYQQHNLVSDGSVVADHTDPALVNPWGIAFNPNGFVWVADNGTGLSTLYDGFGNPQSLVVTVPAAPSDGGTGSP